MTNHDGGPDPQVCPACRISAGTDHPQRHLRIGGQSACVDVALAPVLRRLWQAGCLTRYSCQDTDGRATIAFVGADALERGLVELLTAVRDGGGPRELVLRMLQRSAPASEYVDGALVTYDYDEAECWAVTAWPRLWMKYEDPVPGDEPAGLLIYQLAFPVADLPGVAAACARPGS